MRKQRSKKKIEQTTAILKGVPSGKIGLDRSGKNLAVALTVFRIEKKKGLIERLNQYVAIMQCKRFELEQMTKIINLMGFTVSRSDLTDKEKVARISSIPIPNNLVPYFTKQFENVIT